MSDFLKGNPLIMPNYFLGDVPMDTKTKASSVSEVLTTLTKENRYTGLKIYCESEREFYCFKYGIEDTDFIKISEVIPHIKVDNYASLPTINQDTTVVYITSDTMIEYTWDGSDWSTFKNIADNISFNNNPNGTDIYPNDYQTVQKVLEQNKKEVDSKVDKEIGKSLILDTEIARLQGISTNSNKVEISNINGNIKIDGVENIVYTLPSNTETVEGSNSKVDIAINNIKDNVTNDGNTLAKLRNLIGGIQTLLNSDDINLDSLQEIVGYIKNNKSLIDGITINKINYTDIVNVLTSIEINKPLSANQGKILNDLITTLATTTQSALNLKSDISYVNQQDATKVDKVTGKSLVLDTEISKLATISTGAEVNVQSDWSTDSEIDDSYIKNKPDLTLKQDIVDNQLNTANKSIVYSINEVNSDLINNGIKPIYQSNPFGFDSPVTESRIQQWFSDNGSPINWQGYDTNNPYKDCKMTMGVNESYVLWIGTNYWYYGKFENGNYWENMTQMTPSDFTLGYISMIATGNKFLSDKADLIHTHTKTDITNFTHTHLKSDVTDFPHIHVKTDITNFSHTHVKNDISDLANATTTVSGLMSNTDKTKLDNIYSSSSPSRDFKTAYSASGVYRITNPLSNIPPGYEQVYGDFWVDVKYLDANNQNLTAYDIKSSAIWRLSCVAGTWSEWSRLDYGTSASSDKINSPDTRSLSGYSLPSEYISKGKGVIYEFKNITNIALSPTTFPVIGTMSYCQVETKIPWNDASGGYPTQTATCLGYVFTRTGTSNSTWSAWSQFMTVPSSIDYVIETWRSGTEWRRTYKSGWVEQGGYITIKSDDWTSITLPVTMIDVNYSVSVSVRADSGVGSNGSDTCYYGNIATTGFNIASDYSGASYKNGIRWEVKGQKA